MIFGEFNKERWSSGVVCQVGYARWIAYIDVEEGDSIRYGVIEITEVTKERAEKRRDMILAMFAERAINLARMGGPT